MCFVIRFFSLIFLSLFRFKTNNYDIKETRIFNYINAKIDNYIRDVNISEEDFEKNLKKVKIEFSINFYKNNCVSRTRLTESRYDNLFYNSIYIIV